MALSAELVELSRLRIESELSEIESLMAISEFADEDLVLAMEQKTKELSAERREITKELTDRRKDRDSRQQTVADLTNVNLKLTVQSKRDALRNEVNTHENARVELEARIDALERIRIDLEGQLSQSEDEKEKLFLNLQEKIDEAETTELTLKEWSQRYEKEAENYQKQISELSASKGNLTQANDYLRAELFQMKLKLETMSSEAEQHNNENRQPIKQLTVSRLQRKYAKLEADLKVALTDLDSKIQECRQSEDICAQLVHHNKILSGKLTEHRKMSADQEETWQKERTALMEQRDKSCTVIRFELEGKLDKMRERMKHIYTEETSKSKEKYYKLERELANYQDQCQLLTEMVDKCFTHVQTLSEQVYKLNVTNSELKKEKEFLKSNISV